MTDLFSLLGSALSLALALSNPIVSEPKLVETEIVAETIPAEKVVTIPEEQEPEIIFAPPKEVVQELPDYSASWLNGEVSFVGGLITTSERQFLFAKANNLPFMQTEADYQKSIRDGHLVILRHPSLEVGAKRPYVLPSTAEFIYEIAQELRNVACKKLRVNDANRLTGVQPSNASLFSVHAAGMAVDLRVTNLDARCYEILSNLLYEAEVDQRADSTREHWKIVRGEKVPNPHFHVVVLPKKEIRTVTLEATYGPSSSGGQSE